MYLQSLSHLRCWRPLLIALVLALLLPSLVSVTRVAESHASVSSHSHGDPSDLGITPPVAAAAAAVTTPKKRSRHYRRSRGAPAVPKDRLDSVAHLTDEAIRRHRAAISDDAVLRPVRYISIAFAGGGGGEVAHRSRKMQQQGVHASVDEQRLWAPSACDATITESYEIPRGKLSTVSPIFHPQPLRLDDNTFYDASSNGLPGVHPASVHYMVSYEDPLTGVEVGHVFVDPRVVAGVVHSDEHENDDGDGQHDENVGEEAKTAAGTPPPMMRTNKNNRKQTQRSGGSQKKNGLLLEYEPVGYRSFRIPLNVTTVRVYCSCTGTHSGDDDNNTRGDGAAANNNRNPTNVPSQRNGHHHHHHHYHHNKPIVLDVSADSAATIGPHARSFAPQDAAGIETRGFNYAGPSSRVANIVFLSDGYLAKGREAFFSKVGQIFDLMNALGNPSTVKDIDNMHKSVPMNRYAGFWNVYGVFQPSLVEGSGEGAGKGTNLQCYRPQNMPRGIQCSVPLSLALAGVAPVNIQGNPDKTVIVVISNTNVYGGTGIYSKGYIHVGAFYNGDELGTNGQVNFQPHKYLSLVNHEVGHAIGKLFDEYDFGFAEPKTVSLANCQIGTGGGPPAAVQWQDWIDIFGGSQVGYYRGTITDTFNGAYMYGVLASPSVSCGYTNYYKANTYCMMQWLNNYFMCPVCREGCLASIVDLTNFELQWPRFPSENDVYLVPQEDVPNTVTVHTGLVLHLPASLTTANQFAVEWIDYDGTTTIPNVGTAQCPQCAFISPAMLARYPVGQLINITARITDNTNFFSPRAAAARAAHLKQIATFSLRIVSTVTAANTTYATTNLTLMDSAIDRNSFGFYAPFAGFSALVDCRLSGGCTLAAGAGGDEGLSGNTGNYTVPEEEDKLLSDWDGWIVIVVIAVGCFFILLWLFAACKFYSAGSRVARPIFKNKFTATVKIIRFIMRMSAIAFMLASLGTIIAAIVLYVNISALGQVVIIAGVILAFFLYIMAFVGFWAVTSRVKRLTIANAVILVIGAGILATIAGIIFAIGSDIKSDDAFWTQKLNDLWQWIVESAPDRACALQSMLDCSGFLIPCNGVVPSTLYCPTGCDELNRDLGTPCRGRVQDFISDNYSYVLGVVIAAAVMMVLAIFFNAIYLVSLSRMKKEIRERLTQRSYNHARKNNVSVTKVEHTKALTILKTLDASDVNRLIKEFFRIDVNGDGEIDRSEMTVFFRRALCHHITKNELDVLYEVADLDGNGTISLEEFLIIFNHKMPTIEENPDAYKYAFRRQDTTADMVGKSLNKVKTNLQFGLTPLHNLARKSSIYLGRSGSAANSEDVGANSETSDKEMRLMGGSGRRTSDSPQALTKKSSKKSLTGGGGGDMNDSSMHNDSRLSVGSASGVDMMRRRSSLAAGFADFGRRLGNVMNYDDTNEGGMEEANQKYFRTKTEDDIERELDLRKRAQSRLENAGLYTEADAKAHKELEAQLESMRSASRNRPTAAMLNSYPDPFAAGSPAFKAFNDTNADASAANDSMAGPVGYKANVVVSPPKAKAPARRAVVMQQEDDDDMGISMKNGAAKKPSSATGPRASSPAAKPPGGGGGGAGVPLTASISISGVFDPMDEPMLTTPRKKTAAGGKKSTPAAAAPPPLVDDGMLDVGPAPTMITSGGAKKSFSKDKRPSLALSDMDLIPNASAAVAKKPMPKKRVINSLEL